MAKFIVSEVIETRTEYVVEAHDAREAESHFKSYKRTFNGTALGKTRFSSTEAHIVVKEMRGVINND